MPLSDRDIRAIMGGVLLGLLIVAINLARVVFEALR